jgi:hypothetical protein
LNATTNAAMASSRYTQGMRGSSDGRLARHRLAQVYG